MKKIFLSFSILFLISFSLNAQAGYLGNKFSANLSGDFLPSFKNNSFEGLKSSGGINLSYVISDNKEIGVEFNTFKDWHALFAEEYNSYYNLNYLKQASFGVNYKGYLKKGIAPLGVYGKITIAYTKNYVSDDINFTQPENYNGFKFGFGVGKQRILMDKLIIDIGALSNFNLINKSSSENASFENFNTPISRIALREILYIHLGLGYLIF